MDVNCDGVNQLAIDRLIEQIDLAKQEAEVMVASEVIAGNTVKENWARGEVTMATKIKAIITDEINYAKQLAMEK